MQKINPAVAFKPSVTDIGGAQPSNVRALLISTCKSPHSRCDTSPLPIMVAQTSTSFCGTGKSLAFTPSASAQPRSNSVVEISCPLETKKGLIGRRRVINTAQNQTYKIAYINKAALIMNSTAKATNAIGNPNNCKAKIVRLKSSKCFIGYLRFAANKQGFKPSATLKDGLKPKRL